MPYFNISSISAAVLSVSSIGLLQSPDPVTAGPSLTNSTAVGYDLGILTETAAGAFTLAQAPTNITAQFVSNISVNIPQFLSPSHINIKYLKALMYPKLTNHAVPLRSLRLLLLCPLMRTLMMGYTPHQHRPWKSYHSHKWRRFRKIVPPCQLHKLLRLPR